MGGIMFIAATAIVVLVLDIQDIMAGELTAVVVFLFAGVFGVIGFLDDYAKVKKKENTGLSASQKFLLQLAAALCFLALLRSMGILSPNLYVPFLGVELRLPWVVYLIFAALVITGSVNAVNITDGIDGLAAGVTLPVCAFFACSFGYAYLHWQRQESMGMTLFAAALCGALMGFLVHNFHPAKVFMGDTGSLFLGGMVCGLAFALDIPLVLPIIGLVYGLRPGYAPDFDPCGDHLYRGDLVGYHPDRLLQGHPRQTDLPHGPPAPPFGAGRLEREEVSVHLCRHHAGLLCPGLFRRHGAVLRPVSPGGRGDAMRPEPLSIREGCLWQVQRKPNSGAGSSPGTRAGGRWIPPSCC